MKSNEPPPPPPRKGKGRSRSPPPSNAISEAVALVADMARRTCPVCLRLFDNPKAMWGHSWVHRERRDRIHSTAPPPPPPMHGPCAGPSEWHPWTIDSKAERDRTCPTCARMFRSPKAMYGHLHVHHEKAPPSKNEKGEASGSKKPACKKPRVERGIVLVPSREERKKEKDVDESDDSPVSIDLNRPAFAEEEMDGGESSSSSSPSIDLNKMPPGC